MDMAHTLDRMLLYIIGTGLDRQSQDIILKCIVNLVLEMKPNGEGIFHENIYDASNKNIKFEDVSAKPSAVKIVQDIDKVGYILVLGSDALSKLEESYRQNIIICETLPLKEWYGSLKDKVKLQLTKFLKRWINYEYEKTVIKETQHYNDNILMCNLDSLIKFAQLKILNNRNLAIIYQGDKVILEDATKRREIPIDAPVIIGTKTRKLDGLEQSLNKLGYIQPFISDIDEFIFHLKLIFNSESNIQITLSSPNAKS